MTEIAIFAENSLFAPSEPFFVETQTCQKGRKKEQNGKIGEAILGDLNLIGCHKNLSESLRIIRNQSEPIRINQSQSELIRINPNQSESIRINQNQSELIEINLNKSD